jgi:enoyl-CoA hydratase
VPPARESTVRYERRGRILVVRIAREVKRNAVDRATAHGIDEALNLLDDDDELWAGVITGTTTVFSAGTDLKDGSGRSERGGEYGLIRRRRAKPLIAAVEGPAFGGGFEIALACDLIVASEVAIFGLPEVTRGLVAAAGGLFRLPRRVPYHLAMEIALTGGHVPAARLHQAGLISALVPAGEALGAARALATKVAANAPLAVAATKRIIVESADWPSGEAFDRQNAISGPVFTSADAREGAAAFAQKRPPVWRGE